MVILKGQVLGCLTFFVSVHHGNKISCYLLTFLWKKEIVILLQLRTFYK
jgi:hypothetical protein